MNRKAFVAFLVLLNTALVSPPSQADSIRYEVFNLTQFISVPACKPLPYGQNMLQIYLDLTAPAKSFHFSGPSGYNLSGDISWEYPVAGDEGTTLILDLGGCSNGSILLGTATYSVEVVEETGCHRLIGGEVAGYEGRALPIVMGCDDVERFADNACSAVPPTLLSPVDGALNVSSTPTMTWQGSAGDFCVGAIGVQVFRLYLGTSLEDLADVYVFPDTTQWQLANLLPETTYYWRMSVEDYYWDYRGSNYRVSPIHSFTTGAPVAVEEMTWSTIKQSYRE